MTAKMVYAHAGIAVYVTRDDMKRMLQTGFEVLPLYLGKEPATDVAAFLILTPEAVGVLTHAMAAERRAFDLGLLEYEEGRIVPAAKEGDE